jgi:hypothetical protein
MAQQSGTATSPEALPALPPQMQRAVYTARVVTGVAAGAASGVLGLGGLTGLLFYLITSVVSAVLLLLRFSLYSQQPTTPRAASFSTLFQEGLFHSLTSFVLFWALFNGIVHVY